MNDMDNEDKFQNDNAIGNDTAVGNAQRPGFPMKLSAHESHMLMLRATVLVQALKDLEKVSNELRELRDTLAAMPYDSQSAFSRIQANIEDRKVTLTCIRNSIIGHRNRLEDVLERISREAHGAH